MHVRRQHYKKYKRHLPFLWLFSVCKTCLLTVGCLICEQCCQLLVLLLLGQQFDGQVGPCHHCYVLLLLISQNLLLCLQY